MKTTMAILFLALLMIGVVSASTPTLSNTINLNGSAGREARMQEIDDSHLMILDQTSGTCRLRVVNPSTGSVVDSLTFACTYIMDVDYSAGTVVTCTSQFLGGTGTRHQVRVYKYPDDGFLEYKGAYTSSYGAASFFGGCGIDSSSSTSADIFVNGLYYGGSAKTGVVKVFLNGSSTTFTTYPIVVPLNHNLLEDTQSEVFGTGGDFYNNSDPYNHTGQILDSLVAGTNLRAWNFDSSNPEYVTDDGYIVIAGDYTSITESSGSVTMDDILSFADRSEIYGIIDGWWYVGDFTNAGSPTLTNTSVALSNYDASPDARTTEWLTTASRIYYMNETNDVLTVWTYDSAPNCLSSDGCILYEPFSYSTSVLSNGWSGSDVNPVNQAYICNDDYGYQENYRDINRISDEPFILTAELALCDGDSTEFYLSMGDGGLTSLALSITDSGVITDHTGDILGSFPVTCDGYTNHSTLEILGYPDSSPKSWGVYVNDVLIEKNLPFTTEGNAQDITWIYIGGNLIPDYCNYSLDLISIYEITTATTDEALEAQRREFGSFTLDPSEDFEFNTDLCRAGENHQICFIRVLITDILGGAWRTFVKYPLEVIAFLIIFIVVMIASKNKR